MTEKQKHNLAELAASLVTPERFGAIAVENVVELRLPELARVYELPPYRNNQSGMGA